MQHALRKLVRKSMGREYLVELDETGRIILKTPSQSYLGHVGGT